jgi:hypothetical protein
VSYVRFRVNFQSSARAPAMSASLLLADVAISAAQVRKVPGADLLIVKLNIEDIGC